MLNRLLKLFFIAASVAILYKVDTESFTFGFFMGLVIMASIASLEDPGILDK